MSGAHMIRFSYILSIGLWATPLVDNATVRVDELWNSLVGRRQPSEG